MGLKENLEKTDFILEIFRNEISDMESTNYDATEPNLDDIQKFISNDYKNALEDEKTTFGLSDASKTALKYLQNSGSLLYKYVVMDYMELAKIYRYLCLVHIYRLNDTNNPHELRRIYLESSALIDSVKNCFDSLSVNEFSVVFTLLLALANEEQIFTQNDNLLTDEQRKKIIEFLKVDYWSNEYQEEFLKEFRQIKIYLEHIEGTEEGYSDNITVADVILKLKELKKKGDILGIITSSIEERKYLDEHFEKETDDTSIFRALLFKYDELALKGLINYAMTSKANISNKERRKLLESCTLDGEDTSIPTKIKKILDIIYNYYNACIRDKKVFESTKTKKINSYNTSLSILEGITEDTLITEDMARQILKGLFSGSFTKKVQYWIMKHNEKIYNKTQEKYALLSSEERNKIVALFRKYNLPLDEAIYEKVIRNSSSDISKMIKLLSKQEFSSLEIVNILCISDLDTVIIIDEYLKSGFINKYFLLRNISFFDINSGLLKKYQKIQKFLKDHRINPQLFINNVEILIESDNTLFENILYLESCNLLSALRKMGDYSLRFLTDKDLCNKIDKFIECGCYEALQNDLSLLSIPSQRLKRIDVMTSMNFPITLDDDEFNINNLLLGKFFIADEDLDSFISTPSIQEEDKSWKPSDEVLSRFRITNNSPIIQIGDINISYYKIKRKMSEGLSFIEALFYNRCCDNDTYTEIIDELKPIIKEKK